MCRDVQLNPDEKESSITDVNALSASARYLRLEVVDNGSLPVSQHMLFSDNSAVRSKTRDQLK